MKKALIFGISGQDGAYLAKNLIDHGYEVAGTSRDAEMSPFANLDALGIRDSVTLHSANPADFRSVMQVMISTEPRCVFNLSGQSSVGLSFNQPIETMESVMTATLNILEAIRFLDSSIRFYNAGSSEAFGNTLSHAATEKTAFRPRSPYATAKAAAVWAVANYREAYGLFATSGILFNHESPLRPPRFVTRKIVKAAAAMARGEGPRTLVLGNLNIQRDWGWAPEYVEVIRRMVETDTPDDYVIATGHTHSLEDFVRLAFAAFGLDWREHVRIDENLYRPADIAYSAGDPARAETDLGWRARILMPEVVQLMADAERSGGQMRPQATGRGHT
ncbi:GDP-mannose 4,6-dehydratase [Roseospira navarrensis]|uniref:GDP-mannose 4,6-dehydratase n=1 Tax=Roseospira navarrensis TaxID=140058 RepID=A0A7X2D321_9PROT|nr:GDP-mannose 4,6-dehydratase [Roseospira navarrensis]MQX36368.1 NAD-dependent epimerase/dehydratase family protein [Roseospira navarrensis]